MYLPLDKTNCGKSGLGYRASGPPGRRAVAGRGPRAAGCGPLGLRAAGPWRAVGRGPLGRGPAFSKTHAKEPFLSPFIIPLHSILCSFLQSAPCFYKNLAFIKTVSGCRVAVVRATHPASRAFSYVTYALYREKALHESCQVLGEYAECVAKQHFRTQAESVFI